MSPGTRHAEQVYQDLKRALLSGRYTGAFDLSVTDLASEFGISSSPIRDTLHRMYGERLLEVGHHHGFRVIGWTPEKLRDCYTWHGQLIRLALKASMRANARLPIAPDGWLIDYTTPEAIVATAERMFATLASLSGSEEIVAAIANAGERLRAVRLREIERWPDCADELNSANILAVSGTGKALLQMLWNYHRRRIRAVSMLCES
ncbi:MAG: GntR family transcriptional regulator [Rhizobiaceae bacterium]|nr:GntR family transcriptional regulator [Rhizobiaceae bacterium]|tara:strand:- start:16523 stop:17137 length:615 start_codon:yes stop_codon:yes gene_type:complete